MLIIGFINEYSSNSEHIKFELEVCACSGLEMNKKMEDCLREIKCHEIKYCSPNETPRGLESGL